MILIRYRGGIGNNFFTYVFARQLSEKFKFSLETDLPPGSYLRNTPNKNGKKFFTEPLWISDIDDANFQPPDHLEERTYVVEGYFQDSSYYRDKTHIKEFFHLPTIRANDQDIVLHIRLGDYKRFGINGTVLHPSYYMRVLELSSYDKVYIVTNELDQNYLSCFSKWNPTIISQNPKQDFEFLMGFKKIAIANSSFSWWASYLGRSQEIYAPSVWMRYCKHIRNIQNIDGVTVVDAAWV